MRLRFSPRHSPFPQALGLIVAALISLSAATHAADRSREYRFEVVDQPVPVSAHSEFNVKLTKVATGQPVENATITRGRLEMPMPDPSYKRMQMVGEVKILGSPSPGLYRLLGDVSMPGTWNLDIVARVPGEAQPVEGTTTFKASQ